MKPLVVITGASSGIGEASAKIFSEHGYPLLLLARRVDRLAALKLPNTLCEKVDVTDRNALNAAVAKAESTYGPVDCLINNAGVMLLGDIENQDENEWQQMLNVNVMGVLNGIKSVLNSMKSKQHGTIINVSSIAGIKPFPKHAAYCATKFGVHGLTDTVRSEVASDNVRVMTVSPGAVETELLSHTSSDKIKSDYENWKDEIGGVLKSSDIANAIYYAYSQPQNVCIREIVISATRQEA